jgi:hypothetical protein
MMKKNCNYIVTRAEHSQQLYSNLAPPQKRGVTRISPQVTTQAEHSQQLCLDLAPPQKPQIQSIPGVSAKERRRYRVMLGEEIFATGLTSDEALKLAGGKHGK